MKALKELMLDRNLDLIPFYKFIQTKYKDAVIQRKPTIVQQVISQPREPTTDSITVKTVTSGYGAHSEKPEPSNSSENKRLMQLFKIKE